MDDRVERLFFVSVLSVFKYMSIFELRKGIMANGRCVSFIAVYLEALLKLGVLNRSVG